VSGGWDALPEAMRRDFMQSEIVREKLRYERNFTSFRNEWLRDARIVGNPLSVLVNVMSHDDQYRLTQSSVAQALGMGERAFLSARRTLEACGYLRVVEMRYPKGSVDATGRSIAGHRFNVFFVTDPFDLTSAGTIAPAVDNSVLGAAGEDVEKPARGRAGRRDPRQHAEDASLRDRGQARGGLDEASLRYPGLGGAGLKEEQDLDDDEDDDARGARESGLASRLTEPAPASTGSWAATVEVVAEVPAAAVVSAAASEPAPQPQSAPAAVSVPVVDAAAATRAELVRELAADLDRRDALLELMCPGGDRGLLEERFGVRAEIVVQTVEELAGRVPVVSLLRCAELVFAKPRQVRDASRYLARSIAADPGRFRVDAPIALPPVEPPAAAAASTAPSVVGAQPAVAQSATDADSARSSFASAHPECFHGKPHTWVTSRTGTACGRCGTDHDAVAALERDALAAECVVCGHDPAPPTRWPVGDIPAGTVCCRRCSIVLDVASTAGVTA